MRAAYRLCLTCSHDECVHAWRGVEKLLDDTIHATD
jgi:hypothetical protein